MRTTHAITMNADGCTSNLRDFCKRWETALNWENSESRNGGREGTMVDLIVYGATPGGVCAASSVGAPRRATRHGRRVG